VTDSSVRERLTDNSLREQVTDSSVSTEFKAMMSRPPNPDGAVQAVRFESRQRVVDATSEVLDALAEHRRFVVASGFHEPSASLAVGMDRSSSWPTCTCTAVSGQR
jgi:hypothetical protein